MVGEKLREVRNSKRLSLASVASRAKISVASLSRIETSKQGIDLSLFLLLAKILGASPTELLDEGDAVEVSDKLLTQIIDLGPKERTQLWRDLADARAKRRVSPRRLLTDEVEELVAQADFLREEINTVRRGIRRR
jgi:transcriptional regulator with XRE-family HTH domain